MKHTIPTVISLFPDKTMIPSTPSQLDNYKSFQYLLYWRADSLENPVVVVQKLPQVIDILHIFMPSCLLLPVKEALLKPAKNLRQTLASVVLTSKNAHRRYQVPSLGFEYLYIYPAVGSLTVMAAHERSEQ